MCPSYRLVVMFMSPIFDRPKSVSLMCPKEVINKLEEKKNIRRRNVTCTRGKKCTHAHKRSKDVT